MENTTQHSSPEPARLDLRELFELLGETRTAPEPVEPIPSPAKPECGLIAYAATTVGNIRALVKQRRAGRSGSTMVLVHVEHGMVCSFSLGDSRIYRFDGTALHRISEDHTLAMYKLRAHIYTEEEASHSAEAHMLTSFLGMDPEQHGIRAAAYPAFPMTAEGCVLLCTDGITDMCSDAEIADVLAQGTENPAQTLWENWYLGEQIGSGAFSAVYRIEANRHNRIDASALKIEPIIAGENLFLDETKKLHYIEQKRESVENEAAILYKLRDCRNIVCYEEESIRRLEINGKFEGYYFLIRMELLDCLTTLIREREFALTEPSVLMLKSTDRKQANRYAQKYQLFHLLI